jgi:hypothetical protein
MRRTHALGLFATFLLTTACVHGRLAYPAAETDLALRRVVLYRNGIGYFERHGEVDGESLAIKVRRDQVDDLLKSLTVIDKSTGKAMSVSMPLDPESWASAALATLAPGRGSLAEVLDGLRGTDVVLHSNEGRIRGRIVMVERIVNEPDPGARSRPGGEAGQEIDHRVTVLARDEMKAVRLSKVHGVTLRDGDLALQLNRRLDASAGQGMFQQVEVVIRLHGKKAHELAVSYVVAAPMWKPTYRVVLPKGGKGKALLQGWAVVDNTSGEDWTNVSLGLTSGEPIAFRYDLHTPRTIERADLTEAGVSRRAAVAMGETSFDDPMPEPDVAVAPPPATSAPAGPADEYYAGEDMAESEAGGYGGGAGRSARSTVSSKEKAAKADARDYDRYDGAKQEEAKNIDYDALRRSTLASARNKSVSGLTSFDLRERVTVPNGNSTMVAILNENVQAEETFLYKPGGAGMGYEANPYRVVRFRNSSPFVLEPGPISIYSGDSFVGEGLAESVGAGVSATLPFAVEPSIMVTSSTSYSGDQMQLLRIVRGVLEVESFARTTTVWTAKAPKSIGAFTVLVRHSKAGWNYALTDKPAGTEELPDAYLVPVEVKKAGEEASITLVEQTPSTTTLSIWDGRALGLLEGLVAQASLTPALKKQLEPVVKLRQEIGRIDTEVEGLKRQQVELDQRAAQTRENLEAIKKDPAASALRAKLNARLDDFTKDGDRIGRKVVELQSQRLEKKIALEDLLQTLEFEAPRK